MRNGSNRLVALFLVVAAATAFASAGDGGLSQTIMTVWSDREGLPSNTVLDVAQDRDGYIWLGTYEGLVRFDGETFTTMTPERGGFDGRSARVLALGPDGALWIGTNAAGLYRYRDGAFARFGLEEGLPDLSVRSIAFDSEGVVWVGTADGVCRIVGDDAAPAAPDGARGVGIAEFVLPLPDGTVLVGSNLPGLSLIGAKGVEPFLPGQGLEAYSFSSAFLDGSGGLWLGSSSGRIVLVRSNEIAETISLDELRGASVNAFRTDSAGTLWIATDRGVVSRRGSAFERYSEDDGLPSDVVSSLCRDREGNLWVGTERGGLVKFSPGKFVNTDEADGLVSDAVNAAVEDGQHSLWVATDDGVSFFPTDADTYFVDDERRAAIDGFVEGLRGVRVRQIRAEADGSLWFATYSERGLVTLRADGSVETLTKADGLPNNRVRFSYRAASGALWIGTTAGPAVVSGGKATALGDASGLPNLFILCAMEDARGSVWLGTDGGGVAVVAPGSRPRVVKVYAKADGLAGNVVFRIVDDAAGRLWFCTSEGLSLYENDAFTSADAAAGLSGESVFEVLEDAAGRLWIVTGRKVVVVDADALAKAASAGARVAGARVYDRLDGLAGQLSANAWAYVNDRGVVYLPTLKGLSTFNPQSASINTLPPPVLIERVEVDGALAASADGRIVVPAGARRVTFGYTALSYTVPQRVRFQYMLEGFDADWIPAGTDRQIGYTNLPPGSYTFRVRATNNDGVVNVEGASATIDKEPFFYQTPPFFIALAASLVGAGFLVAYLRVIRLRRRADELDALVVERTSELADEKEKSDGLLRNILPPSVSDELKSAGRARPRVYPNATVLFADIVGFTEWSASMPPDAIIEELNALFTGFDDIMDRWDCERIKTIGDGYLACSGLGAESSDHAARDHAARMVSAGVDMLRFVETRTTGQSRGLRIKIGVDSGPIVGGVVGIKKYIFDVFGDTVNTAFRLEAMTAPMGLTVSAGTAELLGSKFPLLRRPRRQVKGKGAVQSSYVVYRDGPGRSMPYPAAKALLEEALRLRDAGDVAGCRSLAAGVDETTLEPEMAADITALGTES